MNVLKLIPEFKYMEVNNLTGLRTGQVLSQFPAAYKMTGEDGKEMTSNGITVKGSAKDVKYIENGLITALNADGQICNYDPALHTQPFVHFTEPLNTVVDKLSAFAVEWNIGDAEEAFPRCVGLYVGDSFTTNNYTGVLEGCKAATVANGIIKLQSAADKTSMFVAKATTMPNGDKGVEVTYVGKVIADPGK